MVLVINNLILILHKKTYNNRNIIMIENYKLFVNQTLFRNILLGKRNLIYMLGKNLCKHYKSQVLFVVAVMSSFFFCLSPFQSQRLMFVFLSLFGTWTKTLVTAQAGGYTFYIFTCNFPLARGSLPFFATTFFV